MNALHDELSLFAGNILGAAHPTPRFAASPHYTIDTGIEVYRNNYRGNLQDALAAVYPVVQRLVGEDFFRRLARDFIALHPSRSASLFDYGGHLDDFLAGYAPADSLAYLPDMARLEWACHVAYFAEDGVLIDLVRLGQVAPEDHHAVSLHLHAACRIVTSRHPIVSIWQAHQSGNEVRFNFELNNNPETAFVYRQADVVHVIMLAVDEAACVTSLMQGMSLGAVAAHMADRFPAFDLSQTLLKLAALDALSDFTLEVTA